VVSSLHQLLVQQDQLVLQLTAILQEDVLTIQSLANLVDVQITNAILHPTNVKSSFQIVMMVIHVLLTPSTHPLAVFIPHCVLLQICVLSQLAPEDNVATLQRTVMMEMFAQLTLAIFALEHVYTLQSRAHVELETLVLATLKLQFVKSENLVSTTVTVLLTEIQHTLHSVTQQLDVMFKSIRTIK